MFWALLILSFIAYSIGVFFIESWWALLCLSVLQILLLLTLRINSLRALKNFLLILPLIVLTFVLNFWFVDLNTALLFSVRLLLISNMGFIFATKIPILKFVRGLEILMLPLRVFRVNTRSIAVTMAIAITFVPIVFDEYKKVREAMHAKGTRPKLILTSKIFMYKILYSSSTLSHTLHAKGYQ